MKIAKVELHVEMTDEADCDAFCTVVDQFAKMLCAKGKWIGLNVDYITGYSPENFGGEVEEVETATTTRKFNKESN